MGGQQTCLPAVVFEAARMKTAMILEMLFMARGSNERVQARRTKEPRTTEGRSPASPETMGSAT